MFETSVRWGAYLRKNSFAKSPKLIVSRWAFTTRKFCRNPGSRHSRFQWSQQAVKWKLRGRLDLRKVGIELQIKVTIEIVVPLWKPTGFPSPTRRPIKPQIVCSPERRINGRYKRREGFSVQNRSWNVIERAIICKIEKESRHDRPIFKRQRRCVQVIKSS